MAATILLVDIGNSTIQTAHYNGRDIQKVHRIATDAFTDFLDYLSSATYDNIIVSSVVPALDDTLVQFPNVTFINSRNIPMLHIDTPAPEQVGADRLVNALAAYDQYRTNCLIIDSGTAVTFCYVDENGHYQGGAIFPGMKIASKALQLYTAKIPLIHVAPQTEIIGKTTKEAVQVGIYHGYIYLINGFIQTYKNRYTPLKVIGTGAGLDVLKRHLLIDEYDPDLILKGLAICADGVSRQG